MNCSLNRYIFFGKPSMFSMNEKEVIRTIVKQTPVYSGHVLRKAGFSKIIIRRKVDGKRPRGKPQTIWISNIR